MVPVGIIKEQGTPDRGDAAKRPQVQVEYIVPGKGECLGNFNFSMNVCVCALNMYLYVNVYVHKL